ncbi:beta-1,4-galactosyltransferase 5-like isoform X1 [Branchiostoma lanceolatum]|uniref:beta-1,4-galactosyltransferase 5-like isoform X1 n=2 Tax=Branchiostoma lanceolatum TaxID=7740 RepID=UPI0011330A60
MARTRMNRMRIKLRALFAALMLFSVLCSVMYYIYAAPGAANTLWFTYLAFNKDIAEKIVSWKDALVSESIVIPPEQWALMQKNNISYEYLLEEYKRNLSRWNEVSTTFAPPNLVLNANELCPERLPSMTGEIEVNMTEVNLTTVMKEILQEGPIKPGGHWTPTDCKAKYKVAILVPYRNREEHIPILYRHLIPMLRRQKLEFGFYFIEQAGTNPFNRAMLFNVGFKEAMKRYPWDCFVFQDVDHIPENNRNYYGCGQMPRHFAVKLDKYMYRLPYDEFFGGVSGLTTEQFKKINGFPNAFWGWGGEDDDLWARVANAGYEVSRPPGDVGKYKSIPHHHRGEAQFLGRWGLLKQSKTRNFLDGLNNIVYDPLITVHPLYVNITVDLQTLDVDYPEES